MKVRSLRMRIKIGIIIFLALNSPQILKATCSKDSDCPKLGQGECCCYGGVCTTSAWNCYGHNSCSANLQQKKTIPSKQK